MEVLHAVPTWLCDCVGFMMKRMEVAPDGKTPYERVKGKRAEVIGLEFGEKVMWKYHPGKRMEKINARWGPCNFFWGGEVEERGVDRGG